MNHDEIVDELVKAQREPEPENWPSQYTPERGEAYAAEVRDLEAELDEGWPGWRKKQPFNELPTDKIAWIKLRLKRRDLIVRGKGDWGVHIVWQQKPAGSWPMAIPIRPPRSGPPGERFRPIASASMLSKRLGRPLKDVRDALALVPDNERAVAEWVQAHLERRDAPPTEAAPAPTPDSERRGGGELASPLGDSSPSTPNADEVR